MLEALGSALAGGAGGLFGIVGALLTGGLDMIGADKKSKRDIERLVVENDHELKMIQSELELTAAEQSRNAAAAEHEERLAAIEAEGAQYVAAMKDSSKRISRPDDPWIILALDALRMSIRPLITLAAVAYMAGLTWMMLDASDQYQLALVAPDILRSVIDMALSLSGLAIGFWFGQRGLKASAAARLELKAAASGP